MQNDRIVFDQHATFVIAPNTSRSRISRSSSEDLSKEVERLFYPLLLINLRGAVSLNAGNEQDHEKTLPPKTR